MKRPVILLVLWVLVAPSVFAQERAKAADNPRAVMPATRRVDTLKGAAEFVELRSVDSEKLVAQLPDPFFRTNSPGPRDTKPVVKAHPHDGYSTAELLARAAVEVRPTGTMLIGSEHYLLLNGRRMKSGDVITISLDGIDLQVTVLAIQRNSYTLRLKEDELRREFK